MSTVNTLPLFSAPPRARANWLRHPRLGPAIHAFSHLGVGNCPEGDRRALNCPLSPSNLRIGVQRCLAPPRRWEPQACPGIARPIRRNDTYPPYRCMLRTVDHTASAFRSRDLDRVGRTRSRKCGSSERTHHRRRTLHLCNHHPIRSSGSSARFCFHRPLTSPVRRN